MSPELKDAFIFLYLSARKALLSADEHQAVQKAAEAVERALTPKPEEKAPEA